MGGCTRAPRLRSALLRNTAVVELIVVLPIALMPLVAMAEGRRWSVPGVALWLASSGFLVLWFVTAWRAFDRADAGLEGGSILAGGEWVIAAGLAALASVLVTRRRRRTWGSAPSVSGSS